MRQCLIHIVRKGECFNNDVIYHSISAECMPTLILPPSPSPDNPYCPSSPGDFRSISAWASGWYLSITRTLRVLDDDDAGNRASTPDKHGRKMLARIPQQCSAIQLSLCVARWVLALGQLMIDSLLWYTYTLFRYRFDGPTISLFGKAFTPISSSHHFTHSFFNSIADSIP